jgi:hypothetical protein
VFTVGGNESCRNASLCARIFIWIAVASPVNLFVGTCNHHICSITDKDVRLPKSVDAISV